MFGNCNCSDCPIPLYGNNVISPIMCHFSIPQPWSPQQHGITRIHHTILKYSERSYVKNAMNIYLQIFLSTPLVLWLFDLHPQIIWCKFKLWKPQPQSQLFFDNISSGTFIQQQIFYCIRPNLYLDNCHAIIYYYSNCPYFWY